MRWAFLLPHVSSKSKLNCARFLNEIANLVLNWDKIHSKQVLPESPIGFLVPIPDNITDLSIIRKVSNPKDSFLMLGPVRFVNSDCNPNAEYDFSSENKVVKLRSLRSINPKEEILVKYSEDFFESYCCLCRSCQSKTSEKDVLSPKVVELFTSFVDDEIKKIVIDLIEEQQIQIASKVV